MAYYGAVHNNQSLLVEAHRQCQLYREVLQSDKGLWAHILLGNGTHDPGLWATGNAWAAAGMLRVLATIQWSSFASEMTSEVNDLKTWTEEILNASKNYVVSFKCRHYDVSLTPRRRETCCTIIWMTRRPLRNLPLRHSWPLPHCTSSLHLLTSHALPLIEQPPVHVEPDERSRQFRSRPLIRRFCQGKLYRMGHSSRQPIRFRPTRCGIGGSAVVCDSCVCGIRRVGQDGSTGR